MKPITLTMQAFGSYGKKTNIDFTNTRQNLFLVTGDTGAGKTTIFDAMVFALYGEASSGNNKKDGVELQSQYVDFDVEPFVELEFTELEGGEEHTYTVRRIPRHLRPAKRKGAKDQIISESLSLLMPDGSEYPQKEANAKLLEIVGLTKSQFMQVAMIAQGEFMELLRAKSDDKKAIFRKLFGTELYQKLVDELGNRKKEKLTDISRIKTACQTEAGHVKVPEYFVKAKKMSDLQQSILRSDRMNVADMEDFLELLSELLELTHDRQKSMQETYDLLTSDRDKKMKALTEGQTIAISFKQLEEAEQSLRECEASKEQIESSQKLISDIKKAYDIKADFIRYNDQQNLLNDTERKLKEQEEKLPSLSEAEDKAVQKETDMQKAAAAETGSYAKIYDRVSKSLELFGRIKAAEANVRNIETSLAKLDKASREADEAFKSCEKEEAECRRLEEELSDTPEKLARWQAKGNELTALDTEYETAKKSYNAANQQAEQFAKAQEDYISAREKFNLHNADYMAKQNSFLDAQAGFLAKEKLKSGLPCPVCGSLEHPSPCRLSDEHKELTRELIDELAKKNEALRTTSEKAASAAKAAKELLSERKARSEEDLQKLLTKIKALIPELPEDTDIKTAMVKLNDRKKSFNEEGKTLKEKDITLKKLKSKLTEIEEKKPVLKKQAELSLSQLSEQRIALAGQKQALESLIAQKDYESENAASEALDQAKQKKEIADNALSDARKESQKAKAEKEGAQALISRYKGDLPSIKDELSERRKQYEALLTDNAMTEEEWQSITESHTQAEVAELQQSIDDHTRKKTSAETAIHTAKTAIGDKPKPELEALAESVKEAEEKWKAGQEELNILNDELNVNKRAFDALNPRMSERADVVTDFNRIDGLYNRLAGKVTGARMDIETFVQRYYLERILYAANLRFSDMSAGQFELRMVEDEQAGEGKNRGLDLMVYSTVTGKVREVRTLSGGESFMAALSLALGMADQIQENSAAINLDVMFIDEGFGSLDDHSRDQAIRVLQRMASGSKLIGIISHVTELKQEIEDQLIVTKDEEGSRVRWEIS